MNVTDFDFALPADLIAQTPAARRDAARLLVLDRVGGGATHTTVAALPEWLQRGDVLALNDTRVFPARLRGRRVPSGGAVECLLLERLDEARWSALVHPGQKLRVGECVRFERRGRAIDGQILERRFFGRRVVRLTTGGGSLDDAIDVVGHVPLPPYIRRPDSEADRERYQTVYARARGSVAAPTAGLHLTAGLLRAVGARGVDRVDVTLHVGYGTFKPVRVERVEAHAVDPERYMISERGRVGAQRRGRCRPANRRGWDDDHAGAGERLEAGPGRGWRGRRRAVHPSRTPVRRRRRLAHEFSPAPVVAADAGLRVCRSRARAGGLRRGDPARIPVLQLWRRDADSLSVVGRDRTCVIE